MSGDTARLCVQRYSVAVAQQLRNGLGVSHTLATILARRGHTSVESARRFLDADDQHDPFCFSGMETVCERVLRHIEQGTRICVFGDYDVDGVCSTALLVRALKKLGAEPEWMLPSRQGDGYGLSTATVKHLASENTNLLVTADCGITANEQVAFARSLGMEVVVTDHHLPGEVLPDCPIVHPEVCGYPFSGLCATAVCQKLAEALYRTAGLDPIAAADDLDLVALATVADAVPLVDENRRLVRKGLHHLSVTQKPGLRALMEVARADPAALSSQVVAFRLAPRINAAGRLQDAEAALELLLTEDPGRALSVANELDQLNQQRQSVESQILLAAEAQRSDQADQAAYVLSGQGWHPGVVGIVASKLVDRYHRPCVLIGFDANDQGRGSARSIAGYDLHSALLACSQHLRRFGGHSQAAGLEVDLASVEVFQREFQSHAHSSLSVDDLVPVRSVDALVGGGAIGVELAEELERLQPFGQGNDVPRLLLPAASIADVAPMGRDDAHARFSVTSGGVRARCVAFRRSASSLATKVDKPKDLCVRLELNEFKGSVEPRLVLDELREPGEGGCEILNNQASFWQRVEDELGCDPTDWATRTLDCSSSVCRRGDDRRGEGVAGVLGDILSSTGEVLCVCADTQRRAAALSRVLACLSDGSVAESESSGSLFTICWDELARCPELARRFEHLVAVDPPPSSDGIEMLETIPGPGPDCFYHLAYGSGEAQFADLVYTSQLDLRGPLIEVFRSLRSAGHLAGSDLRAVLEGNNSYGRSGAVCGRIVRVLCELELGSYTQTEAEGGPALSFASSSETDLSNSPAYSAYQARLSQAKGWLANAVHSETPAVLVPGLAASANEG
jgi:single-stranded-DNA-specific exonuclease